MRVLLEEEREGGEWPGRAEPYEAVGAEINLGLEVLGVFGANGRVRAVGGENEIGAGVWRQIVHFSFEFEPDAERAGAPLQNVEQDAPREPAKAVAGRSDDLAFVVDV